MNTICNTVKNKEYISYGIEDSRLLKKLDQKFIQLIEDYNFSEVTIPSLLDGAILEKLGYFTSFPQYLTAASYYDANKISKAIQQKSFSHDMLVTNNMYLTPAACLHIYPMLQSFSGKEAVITTFANVYRHESLFEDNVRLWQFKVREIVFVGDPNFVKLKLNEVFNKALELAQTYDKKAYIEISSDHFYDTRMNRKRREIQEINAVKKELRSSEDLAIASANYHSVHFSKTFGFDRNGSIVTGCIGFGLDRWLSIAKGKEGNL